MIFPPKRLFRLIVICLMVFSVCALAGPTRSEAYGPQFRAGAAAIDVTPVEFPVIVNGYFEQQKTERVVDRLMSRAVVLDDGQTRLAIVVVDNLAMPRELLDDVKAQASAATGIPVDRMLISATHTHSAASVLGALGSDPDPNYIAFLPGQIVKSITLAARRLQPARIGWTVVKDVAHSHCRRWIYRPDRIATDPFGQPNVRAHMHPGHQSSNHIGPSGPADPDLSLLAIETVDGEPLAVVANYAMHYYGSSAISADFCGRFGVALADKIEAGSSFVGMMSQGTSGDAMWMDYSKPAPRRSLDDYTDAVATVAAQAYRAIEFRKWVPLAMAEKTLSLRRRVPDEKRLEWARRTYTEPLDTPSTGQLGQAKIYAREALWMHAQPDAELKLQAIRIGQLGITAIPNEVYAITGLKLKSQSPLETTFNIELANGAEGYIPPPEQHRLGGYTTWPARSAGLEEGAEPKIVETLLALLETVSSRPRKPHSEPLSDYDDQILDARPIAYWRLTDLVPDHVTDHLNQYHGRFDGGVAMYLPGPGGEGISAGHRGNRAVHFAGGHLQAQIPTVNADHTVSLWMWNGLPADARPITGTVLSQGHPNQQHSLVIGGGGNDSSGKLILRSGGTEVVGTTRLREKAWHNVVVVRRSDRLSVFLNGNQEAEIEAGIDDLQETESSLLRIAGSGESDESLEGKVDNVAIFDRPLQPKEISDLYAASGMSPPKPPKAPPLMPAKPADAASLNRYRNSLVKSKPTAYWRLHDPVASTVAKDEVNGRHGLYERGAKPYRPTQALRNFIGSRVSARVENIGDTYSVEMWFRNELDHRARAVTGYLFSRGEQDASDVGDNLGIGGTHTASGCLFLFNGNRRYESLMGRTKLRKDSWNHVAMVRTGSRVRVYLNGNPHPEIDGQLTSTVPRDCGQWYIGGRNDNFANFQGAIDEVALYDRALEPAEIAAHFAAAPFAAARVDTGAGGEDVAGGDDRQDASAGQASEVPRPSEISRPPTLSQSVSQIRIRDGFEVQLVAAEPMIKDPVAIDWGPDGKLWVVEMADYPSGMDGEGKPGGRIRLLRDVDGDGHYDDSTLFADDLPFPNGVLAWKQGVLVTAAPEIVYLADNDGDGKADSRQTLFSGFLQGNQQLRVNGLRVGLDNWVYCASGSHHSGYGAGNRITSHLAGKSIALGSRDFRFRPQDGQIDPQSGPSQYGRNRDDWGNWFGVQNSRPLWHYVLADHYIRRNPNFVPPDPRHQIVTPLNPKVYPAKSPQKRFHSFDQSGRFTSACSAMIYRDAKLFPQDDLQHAFTCEPFHNLVQHNVITQEGASFRSFRDPAESEVDFFASSDRWCRPVMIRTGPDGALWIVDMYRYMIEHPHWLPQAGKDELRPYYRFGEDKGRIYRIVRTGTDHGSVPRLDQMTTRQWVDLLESPNGWQRDMAQRMLVDSRDPTAIEPLELTLRTSERPRARLHALCTLDGMDALSSTDLQVSLRDRHPAVRRHAVRLSENRSVDASLLVELVSDPDAQVRLQLACTLGQLESPLAAPAIAQLALQHPDDTFLTAALTSSMKAGNLGGVLSALAMSDDLRNGSADQIANRVFSQIAAVGDQKTIIQAFLIATDEGEQGYSAWQFSAVAALLRGLDQRGWSVTERVGTDIRTELDRAITLATAIANDHQAGESLRVAGVELVLSQMRQTQLHAEMLRELLGPQTPHRIQHAIVSRLAERDDVAIAPLLLDNWNGHSPQLRTEILSAIASRSQWIEALTTRLETGDIAIGEINAPMRQRLTSTKDESLRKRLIGVFASASTVDRQQVLKEYQTSLDLVGDTARGEAVFRKSCASCHRHAGFGHEIGPNLASITSKTPEALLAAILDPSAAVEAKYLNYVVLTSDGRSQAGVIATETGTSITLLSAEGKRHALLRSDIEAMQSSGKSLMPDGLEKDLPPQAMADVIAFVRAMSD